VTRYELLDRIGVGGMAEIFRGKAVAAGGFEKPVAIKRILPHLSQDRRFVELLIAEAKVLSLLKHRNIVQIFDVGLGDDGQYFLVMEYVDGKDLGGVQHGLEVQRRRMPFDLALHIGAEICEALEHAHSARAPDGKSMALVHRDVSPSNVLLSRAGEVKLTDFGIAKRAEQEATGHGAVRGKFAYISPEQARNEHIDPRSDVFSVGILLWELITNRRLFSGLAALEALRAVREAQVPRPSEIDPRLHPEVDQLLLSAMARDIKHRPTAGQLGAKLRSLRYSLDVTVGDPATELAKIIDTANEALHQSKPKLAQQVSMGAGSFDADHLEATVIRIRTADEFQARDKDGADVAKAREVIDRFEEQETRLAQLSADQLRILRGGERGQQAAAPLPGMPRAHHPGDEPSVTSTPMFEEMATVASADLDMVRELLGEHDDSETQLVARSDGARLLLPQRAGRPTPGPPAMQARMRVEPPTPTPLPPQPVAPLGYLQPPTMQQPSALSYPAWGVQPQLHPRGASPTAPDNFDQFPVYPKQSSIPEVEGFGPPKAPTLKLWMLVVGALVMMALAFVITRAFLA